MDKQQKYVKDVMKFMLERDAYIGMGVFVTALQGWIEGISVMVIWTMVMLAYTVISLMTKKNNGKI